VVCMYLLLFGQSYFNLEVVGEASQIFLQDTYFLSKLLLAMKNTADVVASMGGAKKSVIKTVLSISSLFLLFFPKFERGAFRGIVWCASLGAVQNGCVSRNTSYFKFFCNGGILEKSKKNIE
jgi:hypothetical protein